MAYHNFVSEIKCIVSDTDFDILDLIMNRKGCTFVPYYDTIPEDHENSLKQCLSLWEIKHYRDLFRDILEERVIRPSNDN